MKDVNGRSARTALIRFSGENNPDSDNMTAVLQNSTCNDTIAEAEERNRHREEGYKESY